MNFRQLKDDMRLLSGRCVLFAGALALYSGTAFCLPSLGTLTCTSSSSSFTAQVSLYKVTVQSSVNIGSQSTGSGGGKVTFSPADVHVSLSKFSELLPILQAGTPFQQCTLVSTAGYGASATYTFKLVVFTSVSAEAATGDGQDPGAYTDVQLEYGGITVSMANPVDDGGHNPHS